MSASDNRAAAIAHAMESLGDRATEVTTPVLQDEGRGRLSLVGSAVGLAIGEERFVVTAAHVADLRHEGVLFAFGSNNLLVGIRGEVTRLYAINSTKPDHVDVSVFRLPKSDHSLSPESSFARWHELDHTFPPPDRHSYCVVGFPTSLNKTLFQGDALSCQMYRFAALDAKDEHYQITERLREASLVLGVRKERMFGASGLAVAPDFFGMSGCGAWRVGRSPLGAKAPPLLSGVMVEWHRRGQYPHMLGTRIGLIVNTILDRYPSASG